MDLVLFAAFLRDPKREGDVSHRTLLFLQIMKLAAAPGEGKKVVSVEKHFPRLPSISMVDADVSDVPIGIGLADDDPASEPRNEVH